MKEFKLIVIREKRIYLSLILLPLLLITTFYILSLLENTETSDFIIFWIIFFSIIYSLGYYCYGKLIIRVSNDNLEFRWVNKRFFNYEPIQKVNLNSIERISLTDDTIINEIILKSEKIRIGNIGNKSVIKNDSEALINYLKNENIKLEKSDSWDKANEKGYLIYIYWTLTAVIVLAIISVITAIIVGKLPASIIIILASLGGILTTQQMIKKKLKDKNNG